MPVSGQKDALLADHDGCGHHSASSSYPPSPGQLRDVPQTYFAAYAPQSFTLSRLVSRHRNLVRLVCFVLLIGVSLSLVSYNRPGTISQVQSMASDAISNHWPVNPNHPLEACLPVSQAPHAIGCHIRNAQAKYKKLRKSQSKTYAQAVQRYIAQYHRDPPPGFKQWFTFAKANNAVIIDDYGQLEKDLAPLRRVAGSVLRERTKHALTSTSNELHWWKFANGQVTTSAKHGQNVRVMLELMSPYLHLLPEFTVLQNWDDVHKVCGARTGEEDLTSLKAHFLYERSPDNIKQVTRGCPRYTETDSSAPVDRPSLDICTQADSWRGKHGVLHISMPCFNTTLPMLSTSKLSTYMDIVAPSWAYAATGYRFGDPPDTQPYHKKSNVIYWRGSSTGGLANVAHNVFGHRHRMVMLMRQFEAKALELERKGVANATRLAMPTMPTEFDDNQMTALSRLSPDSFDMNFSSLVQLVNEADAAVWQSIVQVAKKMPPTYAYNHKFVFDLDGNAMSGRFYRLMDSNSVVFKQTIFVEWHDDRLIPWLHYVPVSLDMEEIPILMDYFLHDPLGIKHGELIATESKKWVAASLRKIDLSIYMYRLLLELGHIIGHD